MSGTYRRAVVFTRDGHYGLGNNARDSAARIKKLDRRAKRREAARIEREAVAEFEEDCALSYEEDMIAHAEIEWYDDEPMIDNGSRWKDEADYLDCAYEPDYCGYGYDDDEYFSSDYLAYDYQPKLKAPIEVEAERTGKTLGDILSEALGEYRRFRREGHSL